VDMFAENHKVKDLTALQEQRGLNTKRPTIVFFLGPTKPLPSHDQASPHAGDTVLERVYDR
jgi:hypothetical protein